MLNKSKPNQGPPEGTTPLWAVLMTGTDGIRVADTSRKMIWGTDEQETWDLYDADGNGRLNAADLTLMKRRLLSRSNK